MTRPKKLEAAQASAMETSCHLGINLELGNITMLF